LRKQPPKNTMENKFQKLSYAKSIDPDKKTITGYASTFGWDRDGERFVQGAWDLNNYLKNPVVLWSHDISSLPIAKTLSIVEDNLGLKVEMQFNPDDPRSMQVFGLFQKGFLNAFSVGFIRNDFVMEDLGDGSGMKGLAITKAELYEYSAVSVPANPGAIVTREVAEMAQKMLGEKVVECVKTKSLGEQFFVVPPEAGPEDEPEEPASPADDLEPALKRIQELAKVAKSAPLGEVQRSLVTTTMAVLSEMLQTGTEDLAQKDFVKLVEPLAGFAKVVALVHPESAESIVKTISQIEKALQGRAA
jgi:HK97 family phage prohead protease